MSVDFAVFDPAVAPRSGTSFRNWYEEQTNWDMEEPDPELDILAQPLRRWYEAMVARFPDMNRSPTETDTNIDYCFTPHLIYCSMRPQHSNQAWKLAQELAATEGIGSYDPMSDDERNNRCIVFPDGPLPNEPSWLSRIFGKNKG
jgi:hypothetical protein